MKLKRCLALLLLAECLLKKCADQFSGGLCSAGTAKDD